MERENQMLLSPLTNMFPISDGRNLNLTWPFKWVNVYWCSHITHPCLGTMSCRTRCQIRRINLQWLIELLAPLANKVNQSCEEFIQVFFLNTCHNDGSFNSPPSFETTFSSRSHLPLPPFLFPAFLSTRRTTLHLADMGSVSQNMIRACHLSY